MYHRTSKGKQTMTDKSDRIKKMAADYANRREYLDSITDEELKFVIDSYVEAANEGALKTREDCEQWFAEHMRPFRVIGRIGEGLTFTEFRRLVKDRGLVEYMESQAA